MHETECEECGKVVKGQSMAQARNNLRNHKVNHGSYNRLRKRSSGGGESKAEKIRKETKRLLQGNGRGHSSSWIAKKIDIDTSTVQVATSLWYGDDFVKIGTNGSTATWQLKEDIKER